MPKYTRQHYLSIGNTLKLLPMPQRKQQFKKWDKIFKADNPRYKSKLFKDYVGV